MSKLPILVRNDTEKTASHIIEVDGIAWLQTLTACQAAF